MFIGLSIYDFQQQFGSDKSCIDALVEMKWSEGYRLPQMDGVLTRASKVRAGRSLRKTQTEERILMLCID